MPMQLSGVAVHRTFLGRSRAITAVATLALVAACGLAAPTTTPTSAPASPSATLEPTAAPPTTLPTATAAAAPFRIVGDAPVIERTFVPNRGAILPGAVAVDEDGTYHAWVIAFGSTPGTQDVHHLTSTDAVAWTPRPDDSLAGLSDGLGNPGAFPTSVFADGDGWVMYLSGALESEPEGWEIWSATAPGPDGPWTRGDAPVLERGSAGAWDSASLDFPAVVPVDTGGYAMLFSGVPTATARPARSAGRRARTGSPGRRTTAPCSSPSCAAASMPPPSTSRASSPRPTS